MNASSTPGSPGCAYLGVWFVDDLKCTLPCPPRPPFARIFSSPWPVISKRTSSEFSFLANVPRGTSITISSPSAPVDCWTPPDSPFPAKMWRRYLRWRSVHIWLFPRSIMCPPLPPSPPSGPPFGINFSLRRCAEPGPPLPARQ